MASRILSALSPAFRLMLAVVGVYAVASILGAHGALADPPAAVPPPVSDMSLDIMLARFIKAIAVPAEQCTYVGAYIFGAYLLVKGLFKCIKYSDEGSKGQQKFSGIWGTLFVGAFLIALPSAMTTIGLTVYGDSGSFGSTAGAYHDSLLQYDAATDADTKARLERTYWTIMTFVQMIGLISFVRGLSILRSVTDGNTQVTSMAGLTHVFAGAIAWNLGEFVQVIFNTVGMGPILL